MSFINWGHETPEQKEIRRRIEENIMFEQASYKAAMIAASSTGSGRRLAHKKFYAYGFIDPSQGRFISIDSESNQTIIGENVFNGGVSFCKNTDDGKMYYIYQDTIAEEMVIGWIDITSGIVTELDRSVLSAESYSIPTSLYYLGDNKFLYVDNQPIFGPSEIIQKVFIINIVDDIVALDSGGPLASFNSDSIGWAITSLFKYEEEYWGTVISTGTPIAGFARYNLITEISDLGNPMSLEGYPNSETIKLLTTLGISQSPTAELYSTVIGLEKDTDETFIAIIKLDPGNYNSEYVQNIIAMPFLPTDIEIV